MELDELFECLTVALGCSRDKIQVALPRARTSRRRGWTDRSVKFVTIACDRTARRRRRSGVMRPPMFAPRQCSPGRPRVRRRRPLAPRRCLPSISAGDHLDAGRSDALGTRQHVRPVVVGNRCPCEQPDGWPGFATGCSSDTSQRQRSPRRTTSPRSSASLGRGSASSPDLTRRSGPAATRPWSGARSGAPGRSDSQGSAFVGAESLSPVTWNAYQPVVSAPAVTKTTMLSKG